MDEVEFFEACEKLAKDRYAYGEMVGDVPEHFTAAFNAGETPEKAVEDFASDADFIRLDDWQRGTF